ncbi:hypothetical protein [Nocardiopsis alba]|uniref:Uncharacterized protein n=1 Tax=Nocardiopsis alba (strain ATCC BAA-2165 / BE74) TaxID=1205910 RepID=J7L1P1_NOCAA|nr:hypothetical protein [Nocardiopsis alba]AFR06671.1 hypothetical protein B005_1217 [Nocardiopsis alba ATCC BAA-2165]
MRTEKDQSRDPREPENGKGPDTTERVMTKDATATTWWLTGGSVLLVGAIAAVVIVVFSGGDDAVSPDPARVAELEASAAERHVDQVEELVHHTRAAHEGLLPVLESLDTVLPADGSAPSEDLPDTEEIDTWLGTTLEARDHLEHAESGETAFNVTHAGLRGSVDLLASSLNAYDSAVRADEDRRTDLLELAADLRDQAVRAWSVAATQLDMVSVEAGHGHIHLYLPAAPGSGALTPDEAEDGDGALEEAPGHDDH